MQRDFESMYDEAVADAYWDAREERRAQDEAGEDDDETGGLNPRQLAAFARARGDVAEAERWEAKAAAQDAPAAKPAGREIFSDPFAEIRSGRYFGLEAK